MEHKRDADLAESGYITGEKLGNKCGCAEMWKYRSKYRNHLRVEFASESRSFNFLEYNPEADLAARTDSPCWHSKNWR